MTDKLDTQVEVKVHGEEVTVDHGKLKVGDLDLDMDNVAAQMSYFGDLWAQAEEEFIQADAHYRSWKADHGARLLSHDPKLAEWKVKQAVEASPKFTAIKDRLAKAKRNVVVLRSHHESFKTKASILQSKGAMRRAELDATSQNIRKQVSQAKTEAKDEDRETRRQAAKKTFKSKKKG